jgi:radical SAM protein with 4Fe4S-binding SPASM domain
MRTPELEAVLDLVVETWRPYLDAPDFMMTIVPNPFGGAIAAELPGFGERRACQWLFEALVICQDGTVTMCGADWDAREPLGDLRRQTLSEIWNGAEMRRRRAAHLRGDFGAIGACANCEDWRLADGSAYSNVLVELEDAARKRASGS